MVNLSLYIQYLHGFYKTKIQINWEKESSSLQIKYSFSNTFDSIYIGIIQSNKSLIFNFKTNIFQKIHNIFNSYIL